MKDEQVCECGHRWDDDHEQLTLLGGTCRGGECPCPRFRPIVVTNIIINNRRK